MRTKTVPLSLHRTVSGGRARPAPGLGFDITSAAIGTEASPKPLPTACKPRHHGSPRSLHHRCDLLVAETLDIGIVNNLAELRRQRLHRRLDGVVRQRIQNVILGRPLSGRETGISRCQALLGDLICGALRRLATLPAVAVDVRVGEYPEHPRLQVAAGPERFETGVRPHHGLLQKVFRVRMVAAHPTRLAIQGGMQRNNLAFEPCTQLGVHHRPTVKRSDTESMASRTVLESLRIWNDWTICTTPSTTSHTPATKTSTTIESKGQTRTTSPAITEMMP